MSKFIVYSRPSGIVEVTTPLREFMATFATEDEGLAAVIAKDVPADALNVRIVDKADLPGRAFRDAWDIQGGVIDIDMTKARVAHAEQLALEISVEITRLERLEREKRLKGDTAGADADAATLIRLKTVDLNSLRTQISGAATPTALKNVRPADLR